MRSLWKGALFGGLVLFVWGFISWTVLPWHNATFSTFGDEDEVARVLAANTAGRGIYLYPGEHHQPGLTPEQQAAAEERVRQKAEAGPFIFVSLDDRGMSSMTRPLVTGLVYQILGALVLTLIVVRCRESAYWERVGIVVLAVLAAAILCFLPPWNWFGFDTAYTVVSILDLVVAGLLAGLVIAKVTP